MSVEDELLLDSIEARLRALENTVMELKSMVEPVTAMRAVVSPIAEIALKEIGQHTHSARFFALLDTGEALIKYAASIAIAVQLSADTSGVENFWENWQQPPTLGKFAEQVRTALAGNQTGWPIDLLRTAFQRENGRQTPQNRYLLSEFIALRNHVRGHGSQQPEGYYQDLYCKNHLLIEDCVRDFAFLRVPLIHTHSVHKIGLGTSMFNATSLMGPSPRKIENPIELPSSISVGSTCIWDGAYNALSLTELVSFRYCEICMREHIFFAVRFPSGKIEYQSYIGNHRVTVDRLK